MNGMHGIIFSYEKRNDLRELGEIRSASSIPFGGRYRAVDFALSNLVNAGVTDVGVVLHGHYQSLLDHLGTGKDWDLSRKRGGREDPASLRLQAALGEAAAFRGKMEALAGVRSYLQEIRRDYVALMDGDLVVNLPLSDIYDQHIKSGADITVVCGNDSFETENGTYSRWTAPAASRTCCTTSTGPGATGGWRCTSSPPSCCWTWWTSAPPGISSACGGTCSRPGRTA